MIGRILTMPCQKAVGLGLNLMTGGMWGLLCWFGGLFKQKEGKQTFFSRVMTYVVGHTLVSLLFGTLSFWGLFKVFAYTLAGILWLCGWKTTPPEEDQGAIARAAAVAQDHADDLRRKVKEEAEAKAKELKEQAERLKAQHKLEMEELARKFEDEKHSKDLADRVAQAKREADELKDRTERDLKAKQAEADRQIENKLEAAKRQTEEQAAELKRQAEAQKAELATKAREAASSMTIGGSAKDVVVSMERTFSKNLDSLFGRSKDPNRKYYLCPGCKKQYFCAKGYMNHVQCPCGSLFRPCELPEVD